MFDLLCVDFLFSALPRYTVLLVPECALGIVGSAAHVCLQSVAEEHASDLSFMFACAYF